MNIANHSEIQKLHSAAMELAARADDLRAGGSAEAAEALLVQANEQKSLAARKFCEDYGEEPTRSVLLRSVASLAMECGLWRVVVASMAWLGMAHLCPYQSRSMWKSSRTDCPATLS